MGKKWNVTFVISRQKGSEPKHYQPFKIEIDPDEYVLDGIERIGAFHDRTLTYRHACHHSTCGACGMLVNGHEKLTCITTIRSVTRDGGKLQIDPLRNFPVLSDLVVDMTSFYQRLDQTGFNQVASLKDACLPYELKRQGDLSEDYERLVDCIECGLCISACPSAITSSAYVGPAILAALQHTVNQTRDNSQIVMVDDQHGLWRCHSVYECTAVCPSNVDPAWRIMNLRRRATANRFSRLFTIKKKGQEK